MLAHGEGIATSAVELDNIRSAERVARAPVTDFPTSRWVLPITGARALRSIARKQWSAIETSPIEPTAKVTYRAN